jgi:NAD(P)-dependent dehydrogenase (short-subunit alcohol dehydrogenase family)
MFLKSKTVNVLGGSSGLGLATAKAAATEGAKVVITGACSRRCEWTAAIR